MVRRAGCSAVVSILVTLGSLGLAPAAVAATTTQLLLSQGAAFSILGHSCGGIQEHAYATGFGGGGYPTGEVYMQTRCGGSGRGGGYKVGLSVLTGSVIAPVASGKTVTTTAFKLVASAGKQKPESFEEGLREVLTNELGEQVGVSLTATQTNEEAVAVNTVV